MQRYEITSIPEYLSISSIVAVLYVEFESKPLESQLHTGERHDFPELIYIKEGAQ